MKTARVRMGTTLVCAVALMAVGPHSTAAAASEPTPTTPRLRTALESAVADGFPGAVAYARNGERELRSAAGLADTASGERAHPGQRFRIASNTKAFVSTVLLQLEGERRLSLDDSVEKWLPGVVRGHGNDGHAITVRHLLNHTSGLYDPTTEAAFFDPYLKDGDRDHVYPPRAVIARAVRHEPAFAPGTGWAYSNTNYLVAGLVIEAVTHRGAGAEIRRRILAPLGLRDTSLPTTDPAVRGPHLHGYDLDGEDMTRFSPSYDWTAGAMVSTLDDLARFHRALFSGRLLPPAQQRELLTTVDFPDAPAYGLGVQRREVPCDGGTVHAWGSDGAGPGYTSVALTTADGERQLVLAVNVFDIGAQLRGEPPVPRSKALARAQQAALCD
ncbi:serine hydrolase domain-containing protein [Streptomyces luteolus]|uniref:Serine hydrolase domain-containing protein n=1 Tax=Streptomyces luteolus TaxID=3043615 RepID=A0ABT6T6E7_9ACTN|nr:serine hydrolase domain-containing protein [Streptomyces sp. B-S-A12]MDI3423456.1 serine hydrolase domain-containing protein [Streptomyces sp. B-S-A12]